MAEHKSAKKRMRQSEKRRDRNRATKSAMKTAIKKVRTGIESKSENLEETFLKAQKIIATTARKGAIPAKTASRYVSRLKLAVNKSKS